MPTRRELVTFDHPFMLAGAEGLQPVGTWMVDVDEDLIEGLSFLAYQRVATTIHLPLGTGGSVEAMRVDPSELAAGRRGTAPPPA